MSNQLTPLERGAVTAALSKMFKADGYIDICAIDACMKIVGVLPDPRDYAALRALHCVHMRDISPDLRGEVLGAVSRIFRVEPVEIEQQRPSQPKPKGFLLRLVSGA